VISPLLSPYSSRRASNCASSGHYPVHSTTSHANKSKARNPSPFLPLHACTCSLACLLCPYCLVATTATAAAARQGPCPSSPPLSASPRYVCPAVVVLHTAQSTVLKPCKICIVEKFHSLWTWIRLHAYNGSIQ
jgi:hypothetical protein